MPIARVHALCIGVADYSSNSDMGDLQASKSDAQTLHAVFRDVYGYDSTLLIDGDATSERIWEEVERICAAGPNEAVIVYFAGHGVTVERDAHKYGFLVPHGTNVPKERGLLARRLAEEELVASADTTDEQSEAVAGGEDEAVEQIAAAHEEDVEGENAEPGSGVLVSRAHLDAARAQTNDDPDWLGERYVRIDRLRDRLSMSQTMHVLMIFDSCFSGVAAHIDHDLPSSRGGAGDDREDTRFRIFEHPSRVALTAGMADEKVWEVGADPSLYDHEYLGKHSRHGVFSRELVRSLTAQDRLAITSNELWFEVYDSVLDWVNANDFRKMTPQRRSLTGSGGDFVFVRQPQSTWLQRVAQLTSLDAKNLSHRGGATGRGGSDAKPKKGLRRSELMRQQREAEREALAQKQTWIDMMVLSQEAARVQAGGEHDPDAPRWREWVRRNERLASQGDPTATAAMALAHQHGVGVEKDLSKAGTWAVEARDTGSIEGHAVLSLLRETSVEAALDAAAAATNADDDRTAAALVAVSFVAGSTVGDEKTGTMLGAVLGGAMLLSQLSSEPTPEELASKLSKSRTTYMGHHKVKSRRTPREQTEALSAWKNAANALQEHAIGYDVPGSLYVEIAPIVSKRLNTALTAIQRGGRSRDYSSVEEAITAAERYTDELLVLVLSEFVTKDL